MKAEELTDITINEPNSQIVIELPNGQRIATNGYYPCLNKRLESVIVIVAGRKLKRSKGE